MKDKILLNSLKDLKLKIINGSNDIRVSFGRFEKYYKEMVCVPFDEKENIEKKTIINNSTYFNKNNSNNDLLSQSIAEYFPLVEKATSLFVSFLFYFYNRKIIKINYQIFLR